MDTYMGLIYLSGLNFAPRDFAFCHGQLLSISQYQALFALLGTHYGGDGRTSFGLPDLRGRVPVGAGQRPGGSMYHLGQYGGAEYVTLNITEMPSHGHSAIAPAQPNVQGPFTGSASLSLACNSGEGSSNSPVNNYPAAVPAISKIPVEAYSDSQNASMAAQNATVSGTATVDIPQQNVNVGTTGGNMGHENRQPFQVVEYIIAVQGLFPPRN